MTRRALAVLLASQVPLGVERSVRILIECCRAASTEPVVYPGRILVSADDRVTFMEIDVMSHDVGYASPELVAMLPKFDPELFEPVPAAGRVEPPAGVVVTRTISSATHKGRKVDDTATVFSLGVILWEMLAHVRLFGRATEGETLLAIKSANVPALQDIPVSLDAIVRKALSLEPHKRFRTVDQLAEALEKFLDEPRSS